MAVQRRFEANVRGRLALNVVRESLADSCHEHADKDESKEYVYDIQEESVGDSEGITPIRLPGGLLAQIESGN